MEVPVTTNVLVVVLFVVVKFVINEVNAEKIEEKRLDDVAFVEKRLVEVRAVAEAVANTVCPLTVRAVAEALPRVEVPEMRVENVPVVKDGLGVIAIVEVPEKRTLLPALKNEIGEL